MKTGSLWARPEYLGRRHWLEIQEERPRINTSSLAETNDWKTI